MKHFLFIVIVFLIGVVGGVFLSSSIKNWLAMNNKATTGDILEISIEDIMSLSYNNDAMTLTAQRAKPGDKFALQGTYTDGRPVHQCMATENLAGYLAFFSTIPTGKKVGIGQVSKEFPTKLGIIEIRDRSSIRRIPPIEFRSTKDEKTIVASYDQVAYELGDKRDVFTKLELGCIALALH